MLAEELGSKLGEYVMTFYGHYVVAFLIPIVVLSVFIWLMPKLVPPLPEPDYRTALLAIIAAQFMLELLGLVFSSPNLSEGLALAVPGIVMLASLAAWLFARPGIWPLSLVLLYEALRLIIYAWALAHPSTTALGVAAILGHLVLVIGAILWSYVGLRFRRTHAGSAA